MAPRLPPEIFNMIFRSLVDDCNMGDDLDDRISPFHTTLPPYSSGRSHLATRCTIVSKDFYDNVVPIVWEYLVVRGPRDLYWLNQLAAYGGMRPTRRPLAAYTRRLDIHFWRDDLDTKRAIRLLSGMRGLRVLVLDNRFVEAGMWSQSESEHFTTSLPASCPHLRRLQFLGRKLIPSMQQIIFLSRGCVNLNTLQVAALRVTRDMRDSNPDELAFPSLKLLSIGTGFWGSRSFSLVENISPQLSPKLQYLDIAVPYDLAMDRMVHIQRYVRSNVIHLTFGANIPTYKSFSSLSRLIMVVHVSGHVESLPDGLDELRDLEIVTQGGPALPWGTPVDTLHHNERMFDLVSQILTSLLNNPLYPSLRKIVLWKRVPGNLILIEKLAKCFRDSFHPIGVRLETKVYQRGPAILDPRTFLSHLGS